MSAILSPCGTYRYRLERGPFEVASLLEPANDGVYELRGKVIGFFGVNPSIADASIDDQTVMKWTGFSTRWGAARFIVGNVFAFRATDVRELAAANDPHGRDNLDHLAHISRDADVLVPCWGSRAKLPRELRPQLQHTLELLMQSGKPVLHFGLTAGGDPKHPLFLGYDTVLQPWANAS